MPRNKQRKKKVRGHDTLLWRGNHNESKGMLCCAGKGPRLAKTGKGTHPREQGHRASSLGIGVNFKVVKYPAIV